MTGEPTDGKPKRPWWPAIVTLVVALATAYGGSYLAFERREPYSASDRCCRRSFPSVAVARLYIPLAHLEAVAINRCVCLERRTHADMHMKYGEYVYTAWGRYGLY